MRRRDFLKRSVAASAAGLMASADLSDAASGAGNSGTFPNVAGLTKYVADFTVNTKYSDIPSEVIDLGKKSILDGLGLAICGSASETWPLLQKYAQSLGFKPDGARVLGTSSRLPARFAAFANGVAIHVNDYDDTQLAAGADRVYGLLTHPTVCVLPAALSLAEVSRVSGRDLMLAYHI